MVFRLPAAFVVCLALASFSAAQVDRKAHIESATGSEKIKLAVQFAEAQTKAADEAFRTDKSDEAKTALADVAHFAKLAADSSIEQRKREKDTEISLRKVAKHLVDVKNGAPFEDRAEVQKTIEGVEAARDELLDFMFKKKR